MSLSKLFTISVWKAHSHHHPFSPPPTLTWDDRSCSITSTIFTRKRRRKTSSSFSNSSQYDYSGQVVLFQSRVMLNFSHRTLDFQPMHKSSGIDFQRVVTSWCSNKFYEADSYKINRTSYSKNTESMSPLRGASLFCAIREEVNVSLRTNIVLCLKYVDSIQLRLPCFSQLCQQYCKRPRISNLTFFRTKLRPRLSTKLRKPRTKHLKTSAYHHLLPSPRSSGHPEIKGRSPGVFSNGRKRLQKSGI